jgi:hypothetical protein
MQVERRAVSAVVVGEHHGARSQANAMTRGVARHGRGQHHARAVVVGEHQRALDGTRSQNHLARPHAPHTLAHRPALRQRQVIGEALRDREEVAVVVAEDGAAREEPHVGHRGELHERLLQPLRRRDAVEHAMRVAEQRAAQLGLLVRHDHALARAAGLERGLQAGTPATGHQHVAPGIVLRVSIGVGEVRCAAESRRLADEVLVLLPQALRPHERLVVEARRHEAGEEAGDRHEVELRGGPAVHARGDEALVQLHLGRARVRDGAGASLQLHDRVGLFHAAGDDAARAVVLPAAREERDPVGEQRRGERVARMALVRLAVEGEAQCAGAIDAPALREAKGLAHRPSSPGGFSPGLYEPLMA